MFCFVILILPLSGGRRVHDTVTSKIYRAEPSWILQKDVLGIHFVPLPQNSFRMARLKDFIIFTQIRYCPNFVIDNFVSRKQS